MGKLNLIISMGVSLLLCLETPLEAQISAVSAQAAIEQAQTQPGEDRLGTRTVAELMEEFGVPGALQSLRISRSTGRKPMG